MQIASSTAKIKTSMSEPLFSYENIGSFVIKLSIISTAATVKVTMNNLTKLLDCLYFACPNVT